MNSIPFLYVNLSALCCYVLLIITFLSAKKTPEIRRFIAVMAASILWTGGTILMRLQVFPGLDFWYYVSILSLFAIPFLIYLFVCSFSQLRGYFLKTIWFISTVVILMLTAFGVVLKPPVAVIQDGSTVFLYNMEWYVVIPYALFSGILCSIIWIFYNVAKEKGARTPGVFSFIAGCTLMLMGNLLQIIPGNTFPWDTLSGVIFAILILGSMYRRHMFQLTLIVSQSLLLIASVTLLIILLIFFVVPAQNFITARFPLTANSATTIIAVLFTGLAAVVYVLLKKLTDSFFTRDIQQGRLLNNLSIEVSQSLDIDEIMEKAVQAIQKGIRIDQIYVCLPSDGKYAARYSSNPLVPVSFSISADSSCLTYLRRKESFLILSEFRRHPMYLSMWETEKALYQTLGLSCILALKDGQDVVGLILLAQKRRGASFTYTELNFLTMVSSIASTAVKNAGLYERAYREARIDSLTEVYNYRYFVEKIEQDFESCRNDCLALLYLDLDDFKLYNQLHGTGEGDTTLRMVAAIITRCVGDTGTVFRSSGKVFSVLLPGHDGRQAKMIAENIQRRVKSLNEAPGRETLNNLSVSCGICVYPHAASSVRELMENTDLAVYNAKVSGKDKIVVFQGVQSTSYRVSEQAEIILEQTARSSGSFYQINSTTIFALVAAIDAKDHYTYNHSRNVARYASILATAAGLNPEQIRMIYEAALLHDIGKISIPELILSKNSDLTDEEYRVMQGHVTSSIEMMRHLPAMDTLIPAAIGHHERWDGKGYPRGLAGEDIPISARCLALADSFDAMTSDRPYREKLSIEYAATQIEDNSGTQFDPHLAHIFLGLIRNGEIRVE